MAGLRLIRGLSVPFAAFPLRVTFASHMFRSDVAWPRFCFTFARRQEISFRVPERPGTCHERRR
ncbi:hypothetical protein MPL3356_70052 [Mesorhizobium plurifarium]|uniref:Uncharacterized protein n=1 Tax=Mesorhizobium plurifarium TaxID=69974 RepID=A0A090GHY0_MESPL|nr:hypothetical protein MPL3356_70052 [Mesorhizobium plurifarium]CDX63179.1 hypothetical protein MPL3365_80173 [Mesorhizobium plurifarium]